MTDDHAIPKFEEIKNNIHEAFCCNAAQLKAINKLLDHVLNLEFELESVKYDRDCLRDAAELNTVCARDAADIVRPPGHPLGNPAPERRECWARYVEYRHREQVGSRHLIESAAAEDGGEAVRMVELRDGDVMLRKEQAKRILRAVQGGPVDPEDIQSLEVKP